ncbi:MAG: hypothetical protein K1X29_11320 [Bdellovibrionales bacterium]|nr:hypothetical protein [Bdellovibrionales bacterium]
MHSIQELRNRLSIFFTYLFLFTIVIVLGKIFIWLSVGGILTTSFYQFTQVILWSLKFDLSISSFFALLLCITHDIFPKNEKLTSFILFFLLSTTITIIGSDIIYFNHVGRHISYEYKAFLGSFASLLSTAFEEHRIAFILTLLSSVVCYFIIDFFSNENLTNSLLRRSQFLSAFHMLLFYHLP